jgi:hypothetical protein
MQTIVAFHNRHVSDVMVLNLYGMKPPISDFQLPSDITFLN